MSGYRYFIILVIPLCMACTRPAAKFIAEDFEKPRRVAILPGNNYTVDLEAGFTFRVLMYQMMRRSSYVHLVSLSETDSVLNNLGITDGGQLPTIEQLELCRALKTDGLIYIDFLEAQQYQFKPFLQQELKANMKLFRYPAGKIWEAEYDQTGSSLFGSFSTIDYDLLGSGSHPLTGQMEDVLIYSLKSLPGYVDRLFPAVVLNVETGYFQPLGSWNNHRYAEGVEQFSGGPSIGLSIEQKFTSTGVGLNFTYTWLSTGQWEDYTEKFGQTVSGSGYFYHIDFLFTIYPWQRYSNLGKIELGLNYMKAGGKETYAAETYDYDFLTWGIGVIAGMEYDYFISDFTALGAKLRYTYGIGVIDYADGTYNVFSGLTLFLGLKFYR